MMKKNAYESLTNEQLLEKKNLFKGVLIGFGIVVVLAIVILLYLLSTNVFDKKSFATLLPIFILPVTFAPLLVSFSLLNKEIKNRNLHH